jgi:hypothetical protein
MLKFPILKKFKFSDKHLKLIIGVICLLIIIKIVYNYKKSNNNKETFQSIRDGTTGFVLGDTGADGAFFDCRSDKISEGQTLNDADLVNDLHKCCGNALVEDNTGKNKAISVFDEVGDQYCELIKTDVPYEDIECEEVGPVGAT